MQPIYLFPKGDFRIERHTGKFLELINNPGLPVDLFVSKHMVKHNATSDTAEPLICLQHFPELLSRFSLNVTIRFEKESGNGKYHAGYDWVTPKTMNWFSLLTHTFPPSLFFIKDSEARLHSILGDHVTKGRVPIRSLDAKTARLYLSPHHNELIAQRLFAYATYYYVFCLGSGFDPADCIKAVYDGLKQYCPMDNIIKQSETNQTMGNPYGIIHLN